MDDKNLQHICAAHDNRPDALLEILHEVQARDGFVSGAILVDIADILNISKADIHGVVSFYHDFKRTKPTKPCVQICRAEACQAVGGEALVAALQSDPTIDTYDVYCLGNCALGPSAMVDGDLIGRASVARIAAKLKRGAGL